jgi:outer membrane protein, multidrug efflux system
VRRRSPYAAYIAAVLLGGCSLAPKYQPPPAPEVPSYKEAAGDWMPATPADAQPRGSWWEAFGDPSLNELERQLNESNPDLLAAVARFQQARGIAIQARSNVFPTLGAEASGSRAQRSANSPLSRALGSTGAAANGTSNDLIAGLNLSWEVDLFGRLRNAASAASAQAQASSADFSAVELSLQAELATDYFALRGDDSTIQLLEDTIEVYDRAYELTRNRYQEGIAAATDVDQADTLRQNARSQLAAVNLERAQLEHAIAVLLGKVPSGFTLEPALLAGAPPPLNAGLPSKLLERRPDVSRAERNMAAANAQIGVARAAWFPVFSLTGTGGFESLATSSWFNAPSRFWSIGPSVTVPFLDAGARYGQNKQARALYDEAAATYRKTTLTAYQEVEDSLAGLHHLADQRKADEAAASSAQSSAYHADERYNAGVADYLEVTTTHTAALNAQRDTISVRVAQMNAAVALIRATGGGWTQDQIDHPAMP